MLALCEHSMQQLLPTSEQRSMMSRNIFALPHRPRTGFAAVASVPTPIAGAGTSAESNTKQERIQTASRYTLGARARLNPPPTLPVFPRALRTRTHKDSAAFCGLRIIPCSLHNKPFSSQQHNEINPHAFQFTVRNLARFLTLAPSHATNRRFQ